MTLSTLVCLSNLLFLPRRSCRRFERLRAFFLMLWRRCSAGKAIFFGRKWHEWERLALHLQEKCSSVSLLPYRTRHRTSRGLECLARAVEYLEETRPFGMEKTPRMVAVNQSIAILRVCHRSAFLSCSTESQLRAVEAFR